LNVANAEAAESLAFKLKLRRDIDQVEPAINSTAINLTANNLTANNNLTAYWL